MSQSDLTARNRVLIRWVILPFSLLLLTPTIHPWYLALVFILLPFLALQRPRYSDQAVDLALDSVHVF